LAEVARLRSLQLDVSEWGDADIRALSALPLPHLESLTLLRSIRVGQLTVMGGLQHLLRMPSLARLRLPWLSEDLSHLLHLLAEQLESTRSRGLIIDTARSSAPVKGFFDAQGEYLATVPISEDVQDMNAANQRGCVLLLIELIPLTGSTAWPSPVDFFSSFLALPAPTSSLNLHSPSLA